MIVAITYIADRLSHGCFGF